MVVLVLQITVTLSKDQPATSLLDLMRSSGVQEVRKALGQYVQQLKSGVSLTWLTKCVITSHLWASPTGQTMLPLTPPSLPEFSQGMILPTANGAKPPGDTQKIQSGTSSRIQVGEPQTVPTGSSS